MKQTVLIASDHAGVELKEKIKSFFDSRLKFTDLGAKTGETVDYPQIAAALAKQVSESKGNNKGILICGTGIGMSIVANKFPFVRAALLYDETAAKMSREHNDANIACIGARTTSETAALKLLETFFITEFAGENPGEERHKRRLSQIAEIEKQNFK